MKRTYTTIIVALMTCVFLICFFIGRAIALKDESTEEMQGYEKPLEINSVKDEASVEILNTAENVEKTEPAENKSEPQTAKKHEEAAPERMLFPCGQTVLKKYSQTAVYSETMGDWRAHTGIDYAAELGTKVTSAWEGTVDKVYKDKLWGYTVEIVHKGNVKTVYKNLGENISVRKGDYVKSGQSISVVGKSADIESLEKPHLHFEIWLNGIVIDPESFVY